MTPFIETFSGKTFKPLAPIWADIRIDDIAHGLSNQGRFSGHTRHFYSVAEHSVRVSERLAECLYPRPVQLWGLLHDASEAYLVDLPKPLKLDVTIGAAYQRAEKALMVAVCKRFSLPTQEPAAVRIADAELLATEVRDLMHGDRPYWKKIRAKPLLGRIRPWSASVAEYEFLRQYKELGGT
jgi:hypothetical protein